MRINALGLAAVTGLAIGAAFSPLAEASVVAAYEPFAYTAGGSLTGQNGGFGWRGAWTAHNADGYSGAMSIGGGGNNSGNLASSVPPAISGYQGSATDADLTLTRDGSDHAGHPIGTQAFAERLLPDPGYGGAGFAGTITLGYILDVGAIRTGSNWSNWAGLQLNTDGVQPAANNQAKTIFLGTGGTTDLAAGDNGLKAGKSTSVTVANASSVYMEFTMVYSALVGNDYATLNVYSSSGTLLGTTGQMDLADDFSFNGVGLLSGPNRGVGFDQITITAIPEPASLALLGASSLLLLRRRR